MSKSDKLLHVGEKTANVYVVPRKPKVIVNSSKVVVERDPISGSGKVTAVSREVQYPIGSGKEYTKSQAARSDRDKKG